MKVTISECHDHITHERIAHLRHGDTIIRVCERANGSPTSWLVRRHGRAEYRPVAGNLSFEQTIDHWISALEPQTSHAFTASVTATVQPKAA